MMKTVWGFMGAVSIGVWHLKLTSFVPKYLKNFPLIKFHPSFTFMLTTPRLVPLQNMNGNIKMLLY